MAWIYLFVAGLFEIGWPLGFKMASLSLKYKVLWIVFSAISMVISGFFLFLAQKTISIGIAYAIWTGVGVIGAVAFGILLFGDTITLLKFTGILFILSGILLLKLSH